MTNVRSVGRFTLSILCIAVLSAGTPAAASDHRKQMLVCVETSVNPAIWTPDNRVVDAAYLEEFNRTLALLLVKSLYDTQIHENTESQDRSWNIKFVVFKGSERIDPRCIEVSNEFDVIFVNVAYDLNADRLHIQNTISIFRGGRSLFKSRSRSDINYIYLNKSYSRSRYEIIKDIKNRSSIIFRRLVSYLEL